MNRNAADVATDVVIEAIRNLSLPEAAAVLAASFGILIVSKVDPGAHQRMVGMVTRLLEEGLATARLYASSEKVKH